MSRATKKYQVKSKANATFCCDATFRSSLDQFGERIYKEMHCKMIMIDLVIVGHPVNEVYCGTPCK